MTKIQDLQSCHACKSLEYWQTPDGSINCSICHPPPEKKNLAEYERGAKEAQYIIRQQLRKHGVDEIQAILNKHLRQNR